jgi:subtilisin family serine protease
LRRSAHAVAVSAALLAAPGAAPADPPAHPERLIVRFKSGVPAPRRAALLSAAGVRSRRHLRGASAYVTETLSPRSLAVALARLRGTADVEVVEPDYELYAHGLSPDDPEFGSLWGLQAIHAPEAWERTTGSPSLVVGVIDTGIDYTHPDLAPNLWRNPSEPVNGLDDDANGYIDDVFGIDCVNGDSDPLDDHGHGTRVAGAIGAVGSNGIGIAGVTWKVRLMALKFLPQSGPAHVSNAIECLDYATAMRARGVDIRLTNNSWGGGGYSSHLRAAIERAGAAGLLFVASAGNAARDLDALPSYPASYELDSIVSVAALDGGTLAPFSNFGMTRADLAAPGVNIGSTWLGGGYGFSSGTSMAAPHVSGAAALIWSLHPELSAAAVKDLLLATAQPLPVLLGRVLSGGRLDVAAATCLPGERSLRISPGDGFERVQGSVLLVRALLRDCTLPVAGALVTATPSTGEDGFPLRDDGVAPDALANDGRYTAAWRPTRAGSLLLEVRARAGSITVQGSIRGEVLSGGPPDSDVDGEPDATDNCPWDPTWNLYDTDRNGIGDAGECSDQNRDGTVDVKDLVAFQQMLHDGRPSALCDVTGDGRCTIADLMGIRARLARQPVWCAHYPAPHP